jgi:ubiquinone/menaquinone biosynthesis C-methylase UbiE
MELNEAQLATRETWSTGDYDALAEYIWSVGADLVQRVGIGPGDAVLDVACGTGNATIPAAQAGATVVGLDLTPALFEAGRRRAAEAGVVIEWVEGDAQDLPYDEGTFDVVLSTFGCMFAPDHQQAANEIARVLKLGGRFGVAAWKPEGTVGQSFARMSPFGPPPPPGFQPPTLWGTREHIKTLFTATGLNLAWEDAAVDFRFESLDAVLDEYSTKFGPMIKLLAAAESSGRGPAARAALRQTFAESNQATDGTVAYPGEYLITLGDKPAT